MGKFIQYYKWVILISCVVLINIGSLIYSKWNEKNLIQLSSQIQLVDEAEQLEQVTLVAEEAIIPHEEKEDIGGSYDEKIMSPVPVYICGEVQRPGVYYISNDAIINDVIEICGGFTEEANRLAVNLASPVIANEKIIIPKQGEEIDKFVDSYDNRDRVTTNVAAETSKGQTTGLNLNTASKEELMTLNGIGEVKAAAIIAYRQENGGFNSIDEIKNISGIGEKTFEKIKPFITT